LLSSIARCYEAFSGNIRNITYVHDSLDTLFSVKHMQMSDLYIFIKQITQTSFIFSNVGLIYFIIFLVYLAGTIYATAVMFLQIAYMRSAIKGREKQSGKNTNPRFIGKYPKISIQIPVREEPLDIIERILTSCSKLDYPKDKLEVIIVSDDSESNALKIKNLVEEMVKKTGLNILFLHRKERKGFKAGALNYALRYSSGDYIVVFDVDTIFEKDFLKKVVSHALEGYDAVVVRWVAGNVDLTQTSKALSFVFDIMAEIVQNGRAYWSRTPALVGSGCMIKRSILEKLGGWDEKSIAEDSDMGLRILLSGGKIKFAEDTKIAVEVPYNYASFKKQQIRWIYGSVEMLRKYALAIFSSSYLSFKQKIDNLLYYGQYISIILNIITIVSTSFFIFFKLPLTTNFIIVQAFLFATLFFYAYMLFRLIHKMNYRIKSILPYLGRVTAMGLAVSLPGVVAFVKALLKLGFYWEVTPKGLRGFSLKSNNTQEFAFGLALIIIGIAALFVGYSLLSVYLILNSSAFIYVALRKNL